MAGEETMSSGKLHITPRHRHPELPVADCGRRAHQHVLALVAVARRGVRLVVVGHPDAVVGFCEAGWGLVGGIGPIKKDWLNRVLQ